MEKQTGTIVRTQGGNGLVICRNANFREEITEEMIQEKITCGNDTLEWRFDLATCKLKTFAGILVDTEAESTLNSVIKDVENELAEISDYIQKTIGDIVFFYDDAGKAYQGYTDEHIVGIAFRPANGRKG